MRKILCLLLLYLFFLPHVFSQITEITGRVVDVNGNPVPRASIQEKDSRKGTTTDADGNFKFSSAQGKVLIISYVGFTTKEVIVGNSPNLTISLSSGVNQIIPEVVVTALGIRREKKALGYAVSSVSKKDIELRPEGDIGRLLTGKAPGVNILSTSGLSGSGTNIIIRGINTVSGSDVAPLFIVDGVPFDGSTNAQAGFQYGNQTSSRFLDLDPNNIESVNVLKGLSATTLYGERGRNGVILVSTKNGSIVKNNKKLEVNVSQLFFLNEVANLPDYQNTYGGGFDLAPSLAFSNWGAKFTNPPAQFDHPYSREDLNSAFPEFVGAKYQYKPYNNVKAFFRTGLISNSSINVAAGGQNTSLSASYSYLDDQGFTPNNSLRKNNFGIGGNAKLGNNFTVSGTVNYVITDFQTPVTGVSSGSSADVASVFGDLIYTPRSIDLMGYPYQNPLTGGSVYYRANNGIQNPRWTAQNALTNQKANRSYGNLQLKYDFAKNLSLSYRFGFDYSNELHSLTINKGGVSGGSKYASGIYRTVDAATTILDQTIIASYNTKFGKDFTLNVDAGINDRQDKYQQSGLLSSQQLTFGLFDHSNFINHEAASEDGTDLDFRSVQKSRGVFTQAIIGFKDFVYLNVGGRNSWVSTLERNNRSLFYPSTSISFIPTSAIESFKDNKIVNYLKLRAGYSTSARFPGPYSTRPSLDITTNVFIDRVGTVINTNSIPNTLPNPDLKPELQQEVEAGIEARFIDNRLSLDFTAYNRTSKDQILDQQLDNSTGYDLIKTNAGNLRNKGIEIALGYTVVRNRNVKWQLDGNFSLNRSKVYNLPSSIKQIVLAGYTNLGTIATEGQPLGMLYGTYVPRYSTTDANGVKTETDKLLVDDDGLYLVSTDSRIIGNPTPDFKLSGISTVSYKSFSFRVQFDYTQGGDMYSGTVASLLGRGVTKDTDFDRATPLVIPGVRQDGTPNTLQQSVTQVYFTSLGFGASDRKIFDATVIRLRELSFSYALPAALLKNSPFGTASFSVSGQNLWYNAPNFPKHTRFDPETTSFGVGNSTAGFELLTGPTSRRLGVSLKLSF